MQKKTPPTLNSLTQQAQVNCTAWGPSLEGGSLSPSPRLRTEQAAVEPRYALCAQCLQPKYTRSLAVYNPSTQIYPPIHTTNVSSARKKTRQNSINSNNIIDHHKNNFQNSAGDNKNKSNDDDDNNNSTTTAATKPARTTTTEKITTAQKNDGACWELAITGKKWHRGVVDI